jgi:integrase/recombinase XerD
MVQFDYDIDNFMSDCQLRDLRPKTMQSYEQSLRIFEKYMVDVQQVTEAAAVKEEHIKEYIQYLRNRGKYTVVANEQSRKSNTPQNRPDLNKPISETTINNYLRNMKVFFNYLFENHYIKKKEIDKRTQSSRIYFR